MIDASPASVARHVRWRPSARPAALASAMLLAVCAATGCEGVRQPDPNVLYVAFGDSATTGRSGRAYWQFLSDMLGEPLNHFAGEGVGGEHAEDGLVRLNDLISRGIFPNARVLLYWQGGGGIVDFMRERDPLLVSSPADPDYPFAEELGAKLDQIQASVEAAIRAGQDSGWQVYVATYYPIREGFSFCEASPLGVLLPAQAARANEYVAMLNDRIRAAAANQGAVLVDVDAVAGLLQEDLANYADCNHLSEQGNEIVAGLFLDAIGGPADGG